MRVTGVCSNYDNKSAITNKRPKVNFKAVPKQFDKGILLILDGWGHRKGGKMNPFNDAKMPFYKSLLNNTWGDTLWRPIEASGKLVGLPGKLAGSSEVGHRNIGAGRLVPQDLMLIDKAIDDGNFYLNGAFLNAMEMTKKNNSTLHILTLLSDGFVHSSTRHTNELIKCAKQYGVKNVRVHAFLDGRDVPEGTAIKYIEDTNKLLKDNGYKGIASFIGMKYAMDRARDWDKTQKAYELLVDGKANYTAKSASEILQNLYCKGYLEKDMPPIKMEDFEPLKDGDSVIFANYRNDRTRQLTDALTQDTCNAPFMENRVHPQNLNFVCMTEYDPNFNLPVAFPPKQSSNTLTQTLNDQGFKPYIGAETEKQAHMTFFADGQKHIRYPNTSYFFPASDHENLTIEMQAEPLTDYIVSWMKNRFSKAMLVNFANPDMIGHEGIYEKGVKMLEFMDKTLERIISNARKNNIAVLVSADHGNIDDMYKNGAHTKNPVPFIGVLPGYKDFIESKEVFLDDSKDAAITQVAPSFLDILKGAKKPDIMFESLFKMRKD